ncbi:MAG: VCBS repeat-containing protein, partial [Saprospirales bacterium]
MKPILEKSFKSGLIMLAAILINFTVIFANHLLGQNLQIKADQKMNTPAINPEEEEKVGVEDHFSGIMRQSRSGLCNQLDSSLCYSVQPFPVVEFAIEERFESVENTAIYHSPLVADMDGDCIPEIIMAGTENFRANPRLTSGIHILDSRTGETKFYIQTAMYGWSTPNSFAIADVDRDGTPEIIVAAADHGSNPSELRGRLICYNLDGSVKWISDQKFGVNVTFGYGGNVALADFNQDGIPEVYIYNEIFNAQTGVKLAEGGNNGRGISDESSLSGSLAIGIAANLNGDISTLELAAGYTIYELNIVNTNGMQGNTMTPFNIELDGEFHDGFTSVADITGDNHLDVVVASQGVFPFGRLYVYQLNAGELTFIASASPENGNGNCCRDYVGPPFIGDIDGSGQPSIGITRSLRLITYKYDGTESLEMIWSINTNDNSGQTGMTMFDFNQDGIMEIVYRDERALRIINGSVDPPEDLAVFSCFSGTGIEHPIVADIDNSGSSKIVVGCADFITQRGKMAVFSSPVDQQAWAPSRGIWNQYNYHVFNVDDDLIIPVQQKNNATYANGAFNNFYVQGSLLNEEGTFLQRVPNLSGAIECIDYDIETDQFVVEFSLFNERNASLSAPAEVQVSFFKDNPETNGSLIGTYSTSESISPGDTLR